MHKDISTDKTRFSGRKTGRIALVAHFFRRYPDGITVLFVVGVTALIRFPLRFDWFGEQDQGRFLVDSILYRFEGSEIMRTYFIHTSPLCVGVFSWLSAAFGNGSLLSISNTLGVLAGIVTTAAVYVLSRTLAVSRLWAASIALGSAVVPGVFFLSLYGYPSVYALPFCVIAAAAVSHGVTRESFRGQLIWLLIGWVAFTLLVLLKVDFALCGTLLLAVIVIQNRVTTRNVLLLLAMAVVTALVALIVPAAMLSNWGEVTKFAADWNEFCKPYRGLGSDLSSIWLATGPGTLVLLAAGFVAMLVRGRHGGVLLAAWIISVAPIWSFWGSIMTVSTRHAVPGSLFTAIFLGLVAAKLFPKRRVIAIVFPFLLLLSNWPWGSPSYDLNYGLSGNLVEAYRANRCAFAACRSVVRQIVASEKPVHVLLGKNASQDVLGAIDLVPMIRYEFAAKAIDVRNQTDLPRGNFHLQTRRRDGSTHDFYDCTVGNPLWILKRIKVPSSEISASLLNSSKSRLLEQRAIAYRTFDLRSECLEYNGRPSR
jgi:hypothetical protein